jgi:lipoprotein-anchoring transpeptidase ErfK/SrfK
MRNLFSAALALTIAVSPLAATVSNASTLVARIDLSTQTMTVIKDGMFQYKWKVSTARKGYVTPVGTYRAQWADKDHRSRKYNNAPMPYSIFFKGGYAVHGTEAVRHLGKPASHGCVRLLPDHAETFFSMVKRVGLYNTNIVIEQ